MVRTSKTLPFQPTKDKAKAAEKGKASPITVTAQQSRYAVDAVDAPTSNEIDVRNLSISIGQKEILAHATLHLHPGKHYVLVGRNGTGKSTLLKAMAEGRIPGIAWNIRMLLLGQTKVDEEGEEEERKADETVLEHVLRSNKQRERLLKESQALSEALEAKSSSEPVIVYRRIMHGALERKYAEARQIYERRSGARGAKAKKDLVALEEELAASAARLSEDIDTLDSSQVGTETQAAADLLQTTQTSLELLDASTADSKARTVLRGLGFTDTSIDSPMSNLSGGWKTRCAIASALCQPSDILLLDEPTNFLDLPSILWLQSYLLSLESTTLLLVTHDRDFADAVGSSLLILRNQLLEPFKGNLSTYERERHKKAKWMSRMAAAQDKQKAQMQSSIASNIRAAKKSGDDNKLKQAASRQRKLDDKMGLQVSAKGGRFKLNRDLAGYYTTSRAEIEVPDFEPPVRLVLPTVPADLRTAGALVSLEKVSFAYPKAVKPTLKDVDLTIHMGQRVGIVGLNGAGKSTLVSLICGTESVKVGTGSLTRHSRLQVGHFSQQAVEELTMLGSAEGTLTALGYVMRAHPELSEQEARGLLAGLGLHHPIASIVPLKHLSGGQKVRLALARVLGGSAPPQLLILDEVTTHLDADTISGLAGALKRYEGALVVVSHDRWFVRVVVEGEKAYTRRGWDDDGEEDSESEESSEDEGGPESEGTVYRLAAGKLKVLEGGMDRYEEIATKAASKISGG